MLTVSRKAGRAGACPTFAFVLRERLLLAFRINPWPAYPWGVYQIGDV
jgi:hypothetical protein